jgi:hypothetical protein
LSTKCAAGISLLALACIIPLVHCGPESMKTIWFEGSYDLDLDHAHVRERMLMRFENETHLLGGQSLTGLEGIANQTLSCQGREVNWSYDGSTLEWTYSPPLRGGDEVILAREWDVAVEPDSGGFRYLMVVGTDTEDATIAFRTRDVDIVETSLPLNSSLAYEGNLTQGQFVCYSSRFKLYTYFWEAEISNPGSEPADVVLNVSVPRDGGFQHLLDVCQETLVSDDLGNPLVQKRVQVAPGSSADVSFQARVLSTTWFAGGIPGMEAALGDPSNYLGPEASYWQVDNPAIASAASSWTEGMVDEDEMAGALNAAVEDYLRYDRIGERQGALWALENSRGSCMEHSDLFIACARSSGLPSLYLSGYCGSGDQGEAGHAWVAVWLPEEGWVGLDPTWSRARLLDSGRVVVRVCNPEDYGVSMTSSGGRVILDDKGASWSFDELTLRDAEGLLGIGESNMIVLLVAFTAAIARITRNFPGSDVRLFN